MKFFAASILIYSFAFYACQKDVSENKKQIAKPSPTTSVTVIPNVNAAGNAKIKTYDGTGAVTKINSELGSVELNHEEIKGLMPAMLMEFYVSDKAMLDNLKIGDKVDFVLEDNAGAERIIKIKKQ